MWYFLKKAPIGKYQKLGSTTAKDKVSWLYSITHYNYLVAFPPQEEAERSMQESLYPQIMKHLIHNMPLLECSPGVLFGIPGQ